VHFTATVLECVDPWCTVWSAWVLTMYHAIPIRPIVALGRDHMHCTVRYVMEVEAGAAFKCKMVGKACTTRKEPILEFIAWSRFYKTEALNQL
jgi:hypothetical protein